MKIKYVVQATMCGRWIDCKTAVSEENAEILRNDLVGNKDAWCNAPDYDERMDMTQIVPVEQANCQYN